MPLRWGKATTHAALFGAYIRLNPDVGGRGDQSSGCCGSSGAPLKKAVGSNCSGAQLVYVECAPDVHSDQHASERRPSPAHSGAACSKRPIHKPKLSSSVRSRRLTLVCSVPQYV